MTKKQKDEQEHKEVETVAKTEYDAIVAERDELLQNKPKEKSEDEIVIEQKQQELWNKEVALTLKDNGLGKFADVVKAKDTDELNTVIESLNSVLDEYKVENAYVPKDHATDDEYSTAKDSGDTQGMLKSLFGFK